MFTHYNEAALRCILHAQQEATYLKKDAIGGLELVAGILIQVDEPLPKYLKKKYNFTIQKVKNFLNWYKTDVERGHLAFEKLSRMLRIDQFIYNFSSYSRLSLSTAEKVRKQFGHEIIGLEHLFFGLLYIKNPHLSNFLEFFQINEVELKKYLFEQLQKMPQGDIDLNPQKLVEINLKYFDKVTEDMESPLSSTSVNYTRLAYAQHFIDIIGRQEEINEMIQILLKKHNNCPILIGPKGIGKESMIKCFANQIALKEVPDLLKGKIILKPDLNLIQANSRTRGEYEGRLRSYLADSRIDTNILLYLSTIERMIGTNDSSSYEGLISDMSTSLILRAILLDENFCFIGSTTKSNFNQYIQKDVEFRNTIRPIYLNELSIKATYKILRTAKYSYERFHVVEFSPSSIFAAIDYAQQFIKNKYFPIKALEILDEAAAHVKFKKSQVPDELKALIDEKIYITNLLKNESKNNFSKNKNYLETLKTKLQYLTSRLRVLKDLNAKKKEKHIQWVTDSDVTEVMSRLLQTPLTNSDVDNNKKLLKMEETIHTKIIGQETAVEAVSRAIRRARVGLVGQKRPIASFIFAGPTGVGKTELTKVLSEYMFDNTKSIIRFDMSEYMEKHTIAKLIGSPPGYIGHNEGGQLTEAVSAKPYSIVLFDEVEKAHPEVFNLLLQMLDDGRLTDSRGQIVSFVNTLVILTTNLGAKEAEYAKSKNSNITVEQIEKIVKDELKAFFKPELLNRIDEMIVFRSLTYDDVSKICSLMITDLQKSFLKQNIILDLKDSAYTFLTEKGFDPTYGARPLRRAIAKYLIDPLSEILLQCEEQKNLKISLSVRLDNKGLLIQYSPHYVAEKTNSESSIKFNSIIVRNFFEKCNISKKSNTDSINESPLVLRFLKLLKSDLKLTRLEKNFIISFLTEKNLINQINIKQYFDFYNS